MPQNLIFSEKSGNSRIKPGNFRKKNHNVLPNRIGLLFGKMTKKVWRTAALELNQKMLKIDLQKLIDLRIVS